MTCSACGADLPPGFRFCGQCGRVLIRHGKPTTEPQGQDPAPDRSALAIPLSGRGERRQVTVLFADLVGSLAISTQLDPEELREVIYAYRTACAGVVEHFDGYVAQYLGDGILAYFGFPTAHEDDAERAVRAGLGIVGAVERLGPTHRRIALAVRVGIATGLVVAPIGVGAGEDSVLIGETPNVAARLQALAPPNAVVIGSQTQRLLGARLVSEDLGTHSLKGAARPVHLWRVLRIDEALSRFEAVHPMGVTPLIGRTEEIDLLSDRWARAAAGRGQIVLLSGEGGIGKSRIAETLRSRVAADAATVWRLQCSPHFAQSALHPVITRLERALGFDRENRTEARLETIEALLRLAGQPVEKTAPLLAGLLSVPAGDRYPSAAGSPQRQREQTLAALRDVALGLAARDPMLLIVEDVHWIDPTSQELLDLLVEQVSGARILVLVTFRAGYRPAWADRPYVTSCAVTRLGRDEATEMVRLLASGKALPEAVLQEIVDRTDGVPLFLEEVTKAVLESGALEERTDDRARAGRPLPRLVPATLQDSLMARLDQAGPLKEVAQIGSVIGRQFSHALLAAVAGLSEVDLEGALDQLVRVELASRHGTPPHATYTFKHALVQEAAYESLLFPRRQALHARVLEVLETTRPDVASGSPELLAHHAEAAGLHEKAVHYRHLAGLRASERSANAEAIAHLTAGLDLLRRMPESPERRQHELAVRVTLGPVLINARGPRTPAVAENYARALELCAQLPESPLHFAALWGSSRISQNFHTKRDRELSLLAVAERLGDPGLRLQAHHRLWASLFHLGEHETCCEHIARGLDLYEGGDYRAHSSLYGGHDPRVCGLGEKALALWLLGYPDRSQEAIREAVAWAHGLGHVGSIAHAMDIGLMVHRYRRDVDVVRREAEAMMAFGEEHGLPVHRAKGTVFLGWVLAERGGLERGIAQMREGLEIQKAIGSREDFPVFYEMLAGALAGAGHGKMALDLLTEILDETEQSGLGYWTPELYRVRGEVRLAESEDEAEDWFRRGLDCARRQRARSLELRAAASLARLEQSRGRPHQAYDLLAPPYAWFREGLDTTDLVEARRLLDTLRAAAS